MAAQAQGGEPKAGSQPQAEFTALAGLGIRTAASDDTNPDNIGYAPAPQFAFQARGYVKPWLNFAIYYLRASHELKLPRGAANIDYEEIDMDKALAFSLGARLEPTYRITDEFRAWLSIGVGWGRMTMEKVYVTESTRTYTVRDRAGVFVEIPFGIGASYEVLPNLLAIQAETNIAHLSKQSGKLYDPTPYVDSNGHLGNVGPMPTQTISASLLLGVSLLL